MTTRVWIALSKWGALTVIGGLGFVNIFSASAQGLTSTDFVLASPRINLITQPQASLPVVVPVKNTSGTPWNSDQIRLGTIYSTGDTDRPSVWKAADWQSDSRIGSAEVGRRIMPNQIMEFHFTMQAPSRAGQYREYFRPILGDQWLAGDPIVIQIQVGEELTVQSDQEKAIKIYRRSQQVELEEHGYVVATLPISSGKSGYTTPAGQYTIMNHVDTAYSSEYKLWMPNWMALSNVRTGFRGYGMHSLPYWKVNPAKYEEGKIYPGGRLYTQGKLFEGYSHLGKPVSHGCVRSGIRESGIIYNWAPDGTPVTIV